MITTMNISELSVEEAKIFVAQHLKLPDLAENFEEQDVDGAALLDLTTATIREFLPSITIGKCLKFFRNLKAFQESETQQNLPLPQLPRSPSPQRSKSPSPQPQSPLSPSPPPPFEGSDDQTPDSPLPQTPAKDCPPTSAQTPSPTAVRRRTSSPVPKNFPIEKLVVTSVGMQMINSGEFTLAGKSAITTAVVTLMQNFSASDCYLSFSLKSMAATALVTKYPTLEMGLGTKAAIDAWHKSFTTKLANWRKRCKVVDPAKTDVMKEKYKKQAESGRSTMDVDPSSGVKRERSTFQRSLSEVEILELDQRKQIMITECSKPQRERNLRLLDVEMAYTFSLRRQFALDSAPHAQTLVKEWPSLRVEFILLKELCLIKPEANSFLEFHSKLESILPKLIDEARRKANSYPRSHPLGKLLEKIPFLEETDPEYDIGINIIGAVTGLTYILPTTAKKMSLPHRHLIDISPSNTSAEDVRSAVEDRHTPYIQIFGSVCERQKVVMYADKVAMLMCSSVSKALYATLSAHYLLDVEYSVAVAPTMEYLQTVCLAMPNRKPRARVRELIYQLGH